MIYSNRLRSFFTLLLAICLVCFTVPLASVQATVYAPEIASQSKLSFLIKDTSQNLSLQYVQLAYLDKSLPALGHHYKVLTPTGVTTQRTSNGMLVTVPTVNWQLSTTYVALVVTNTQVYEVSVVANAQQPVNLNPSLGSNLYADPPTRTHGAFQVQEVRMNLIKFDNMYGEEKLFTVNIASGMRIVNQVSSTQTTYEMLGRDDDHAYFLRPSIAVGSDATRSGTFLQTSDPLVDLQVDMKNTDFHLDSLSSTTTYANVLDDPTRMELPDFSSLQGIYVSKQAAYTDLDFKFEDAAHHTYEYGPSNLPPSSSYPYKATLSFDTTWNATLSKKRPVYHPSFTVNSNADLGLVVSDSKGNRLLNMTDANGQEMRGALTFTSQKGSTHATVSLAGSDIQLPNTVDAYTVTFAAAANAPYPVQSASLDLQLVPYPLDYGINPVYEDVRTIDGYGEPGMTVELFKDDVSYQRGTISDQGKFSLNMPAHATAGTILTLRFSDPAHGFSDKFTFPVHELYPLINEVSDKDAYVTGLAPAGSTVTVSNSSKVVGKAVTPANYKFKVPIAKQHGGTTLAVTVSNGNTTLGQATFYVSVKDLTAPNTPVIVGRITDLGTEVHGTAEPGSQITIKNEEVVVGTSLTDPDGSFDLFLDFPQTFGDTLTITATDRSNNTSAPLIYIVKDGTPPAKPKVDPILDTARYVTGTTEPYATVTVKNWWFDTITFGSARADKNGNFKVPVRSLVGIESVDVFATDTSGNTSEAQAAEVKDTTPPPVPKMKPFRSTDTMLTVTSEYGADIYVTCEGQTYRGSVYDTNGVTTINIGTHKKGTKIEAYAVDLNHNQSKTSTITVQ